jgi:hypothetical protein
VPKWSASSERYHHFPGWVRVAASTLLRVRGKSALSTEVLRILRILLRTLRKYVNHELASRKQRLRIDATDRGIIDLPAWQTYDSCFQ